MPPYRSIDALALALATFVGFGGAALLALSPRDATAARALIFAPWTDESEAVTASLASGARVIAPGRWPFVVIVAPEQGSSARPPGAWLIADAGSFLGCGQAVSP